MLTSLLRGVYFLLVALLAVLPASGFTGVKLGVLGAFVVLLALCALARQRIPLASVVAALPFATVLVAALLVGAFKTDWAYGPRAAASYGAVFVVVLGTYLMVRWRALTFGQLLVALIGFHTVYLCVKLVVLLLPVAAGLRLDAVVQLVRRFAPSLVVQGFSADFLLARLSLGNDILTPFLAGFVMISDHLGVRIRPAAKAVFLALATISIVLSFTRFIWGVFAIALILTAILYRRTWAIAVVVVVMLGAGWGLARTESVRRAFAVTAITRAADVTSVDVKREQARRLLADFDRHWLLGKGAGSYLRDHVRDERLPYQYEVQWLGLLLQFGTLGMAVLLCYVMTIGLLLVRTSRGGNPLRGGTYAAVLYALWLASGLTNPYLAILGSSLIYAMFLTLGLSLAEGQRLGGGSQPPHHQ